jgi:hypothetical protein
MNEKFVPFLHLIDYGGSNMNTNNVKCKVCDNRFATGPKIVGNITGTNGVEALKTLLMCDGCYKDYKAQNIVEKEKPAFRLV